MDSKTTILYAVITALILTNCYLLQKVSKAEEKCQTIIEMMSGIIGGGEAEEDKAKDNIPIGEYVGGFSYKELSINKLYLRDDGKVEIDGSVEGKWREYKGHYIIDCNIMIGDDLEPEAPDEGVVPAPLPPVEYLEALEIRIDGKHLSITEVTIRGEFVTKILKVDIPYRKLQ